MLNALRTYALSAAALTAALFTVAPQRAEAQSYQIDCAILLCLSGGWPTSVPCARARAEFIRRITPWPVEPPLQIWRCPMGAAYDVDPESLSSERIYEILLGLDEDAPLQSFPMDDVNRPATELGGHLMDAPAPTFPARALMGPSVPQPAVLRLTGGDAAPLPERFTLQLVQDRADIDISGPEFNFVRSIRVFDVRLARQRVAGENDQCRRFASVHLGSYGLQGEFSWQVSDPLAVPEAHVGLEGWGEDCPTVSNRSVFVEWRDYQGNYGFEQVDY
ncbi:MAG: hypothetical protein AAF088_21185 [Pseudomonadota bacterium]